MSGFPFIWASCFHSSRRRGGRKRCVRFHPQWWKIDPRQTRSPGFLSQLPNQVSVLHSVSPSIPAAFTWQSGRWMCCREPLSQHLNEVSEPHRALLFQPQSQEKFKGISRENVRKTEERKTKVKNTNPCGVIPNIIGHFKYHVMPVCTSSDIKVRQWKEDWRSWQQIGRTSSSPFIRSYSFKREREKWEPPQELELPMREECIGEKRMRQSSNMCK